MFMVPTGILCLWLFGFWFYGLLAGGIFVLRDWYERALWYDPVMHRFDFRPHPGWNAETGMLAAGLILILLPIAGGMIVRPILRAICRKDPADRTRGTIHSDSAGEARRIPRADGSEIQVECYGPDDGAIVVLTHGWGTNHTEWEYLRRDAAGRGLRLVTWDLPGLGDSDSPPRNDYSLESLAADLDLVVRKTCGDRPVVLGGHSIGGMITLVYCRDRRDKLASRIAGIVLVNTTYTDPIRTTAGAPFFQAIERPVLMPLQYLTIALSPVLRLSNTMSYFNGVGHIAALLNGFAGTQSWEELDFSARFSVKASPAVVARGMLGMMRYDAAEVLNAIPTPALVIAGNRDVCCKPDASERMAREIRDARLEVLSPANHMGLFERRERFAGLLADFTERCAEERRRQELGHDRLAS